MSKELLSVVHPETGELTGEHLPRAEALKRGAWCRSTNVFVLNASGDLLCHKRSRAKERYPGAWSTHLGGHVSKGETFETNAVKELGEEAGIDVNKKRLFAWRTTRKDDSRLWIREFVTICDSDVDDLVPQPGEVDEFRWMSPKEILRRSARAPRGKWLAGTHDFRTEYQCMLAALNVARSMGAVRLPHEALIKQERSLRTATA